MGSGKPVVRHVHFDSYAMPYDASDTMYSKVDALLSSRNGDSFGGLKIMLESEIPTPTPIPAPTSTPTPNTSNLPSKIYINWMQYVDGLSSGIPEVALGEYTLKPSMYFSMNMFTAEYYENENGYKLIVHAYTNSDAPNSNTHELWNDMDTMIDKSEMTPNLFFHQKVLLITKYKYVKQKVNVQTKHLHQLVRIIRAMIHVQMLQVMVFFMLNILDHKLDMKLMKVFMHTIMEEIMNGEITK